MSFMKTLATLAVGFAAAKGIQKVQQMGGMSALQDRMKQAGAEGGNADQFGQMAEKMGIPGAAEMSRKVAGTMGSGAADAAALGQAGWTNLMGVLAGATATAAATGTAATQGMMGATAAGAAMVAQSEETAKLMIRAMIQAAKADGSVDADERARILDQLEDASDEELAFVQGELDAAVDPVGLARDTDAAVRAQVYGAAVMAIVADTPAENDYLTRLADALGLDAAARAAVLTNLGR